MRILHILKTEPDETVEKLIEVVSSDCETTVKPLFNGELEWGRLVDDIFSHDQVVCWW